MERKTSTTPCILKRDRRLRLRSLVSASRTEGMGHPFSLSLSLSLSLIFSFIPPTILSTPASPNPPHYLHFLFSTPLLVHVTNAQTSVSDASVAHSNTGLLSPNGSSCCKTPSRPLAPDQTFSPSIFLSHPSVVLFDRSATSPNTSEALVASPSETECSSSSESRGTSSTCFVTSTPIRRDKENLHYVSPPVSSEHCGGKRPTSWRDFGEVCVSLCVRVVRM